MASRYFSAFDYAVFGCMLFFSALIGIFYAIRDRKLRDGTEGYLLASRSMGIFPVAMSLTVSFLSSVLLLGFPSEIYQFGGHMFWYMFSMIFVSIIATEVFLPTYYRLRLSSIYEYLERRFSKVVRYVATSIFIVQNLLYLGINIYGPSLALSEVAGFDLSTAMLSTGLVCMLYTTLGGLKAVLWTDVLQGIFMYAGLLAIIIRSCVVMGGADVIWNIATEKGFLLMPSFETDPRIRYTFWSVIVGGTVNWLAIFASSQSQVQRYLCCKSERNAKIAVYFCAIGMMILFFLSCTSAVVVSVFYDGCDPLGQKCIKHADQILPYMIMDIFRDFSGLPGLFLASVYSASLSTVSSGVNAMVTVIVEDLVKPLSEWKERTYTIVSKALAVTCGLSVLGMAFAVGAMGDLVSVAISIVGLTLCPLLAIFLLGFWAPFVNSKGATAGLLFGLAGGCWVFIGSKSITISDAFLRQPLHSTDQCVENCGFINFGNATSKRFTTAMTSSLYNSTVDLPESISGVEDQTFLETIYSVSYIYHGSCGMIISFVVGIVVSLLTGGWKNRKNIDERLLRPPFEHKIFFWIPKTVRNFLNCGVQWHDIVVTVETDDEEKYL